MYKLHLATNLLTDAKKSPFCTHQQMCYIHKPFSVDHILKDNEVSSHRL